MSNPYEDDVNSNNPTPGSAVDNKLNVSALPTLKSLPIEGQADNLNTGLQAAENFQNKILNDQIKPTVASDEDKSTWGPASWRRLVCRLVLRKCVVDCFMIFHTSGMPASACR